MWRGVEIVLIHALVPGVSQVASRPPLWFPATGASALGRALRLTCIGLRPIELGEAMDSNLRDRLLDGSRFLTGGFFGVLAGANFTLDLYMRPFQKSGGRLTGFAKGDAAMPRDFGLVLARFRVFPAAIGGQREDRVRRLGAARALDLGVFAEKSHESDSID